MRAVRGHASFLADATAKLSLPACKRCFALDGSELDVAAMPLCAEALWPVFGGRCAAPVWVSVGENFNPAGAVNLVCALIEQVGGGFIWSSIWLDGE